MTEEQTNREEEKKEKARKKPHITSAEKARLVSTIILKTILFELSLSDNRNRGGKGEEKRNKTERGGGGFSDRR